MEIVHLSGALIGPRDATRPVDKNRAARLAESIRDVGLLSPIIVAPGKRYRRGSEVDGWDILAGQHRFHAMFNILNWREMPCIVCGLGDIEAQLVTIDENLIRHELTPAERACATAKRKELYEVLHPETKHGANQSGPSRQFGDTGGKRFTRATAEATGQSERAVQRDAHRGEKLADVLPRIQGTCLDTSGEMDALIKLSPEEREDVVKQAETGRKVTAKPTATVTPIRPPTDAIPADLAKALSAYDAMSTASRHEFHRRRPAAMTHTA